MPFSRAFARSRMYRWTRNLHLYVGLFLSPFVLVYAASAVLLNHAYLPWEGAGAPLSGVYLWYRRVDTRRPGLVALFAGIVCCVFFLLGLGTLVA